MPPAVDTIRHAWFRFVDRIIPSELLHADPESLRKARLLVSFWAAMQVWVPPFLLVLPRLGLTWVERPLWVAFVLGLVTPTLLRRTRSVVVAGNYFTACLFGFVTYFAMRSGGLHSPALLWQPVVIMAAVTLVGVRSAIAWTLVCVLEVLCFLASASDVAAAPPVLGPAGERLFLVIGLASLDGLVLFLSQVYESYKNAALVALQEAKSETEVARLRAEDASRAKSQFLANMSHEIRTPLNAVLGMTSLLLDTRLDETQRDYVETAQASGEHLLGLINDILDFSKIEAGRLELEHVPFDVRETVEEALDVVAFNASKKGLELGALVEEHVPTALEGDSGRIKQVLVNLLANAVKFTERGEVTVHVDARASERAGMFELTFAVHDTGIGIAEEHRARIFGVFSQVDASSTRRFGGSGLGLAISKRLAELMGGKIWFESTPGKGSMFAFSVLAPRIEGATDRVDRRDAGPLLGRRVLIVDDNDTNRRILSAFTTSMGMAPRDTGSPTEALRWLGADAVPFDVAILDFQMPEMDGAELATRIRALPGRGHFPIVLATSSLGRTARESAIAAPGFTAYLVKPVKRAHLQALLLRVLGDGAAPADAAPRGAAASAAPDAAVPPASAPTPAADSAAPARLPALRVLLVEDNRMNQKVALAMLSRLGIEADLAGDGREAIQAIASRPYDVVLMDVQMPVMDGLTAARAICHRWKPAERPRLVAMTANAMSGDEQRCREAGMDDYVSKPVRIDELAAALERNVRRS